LITISLWFSLQYFCFITLLIKCCVAVTKEIRASLKALM
jgi:hypothetical protein